MSDLRIPFDTFTSALASHGCKPRERGSQWQARCPAHDDRTPSLSFMQGLDGSAVYRCHAGKEGCPFDAILKALDLWVEHGNGQVRKRHTVDNGNRGRPTPQNGQQKKPGRRRIVSEYSYIDEHGELLFQVLRFVPKGFSQRRPYGDGWIWDLRGVRRILYHLPAILEPIRRDSVVWIVEGEKDADRLADAGLLSTSCPGGAGKWARVDDTPLVDRDVVIVPDADDDGQRHALDVARRLRGRARSVRIIALSGCGA